MRQNLNLQNAFLVLTSYVFYAWWDWRFLSLKIISTLVDFTVGHILNSEDNPNKRKLLLWLSIVVNLGFLGFFKYFNFFIENFTAAFSFFGHTIQSSSLNIILPIGKSFFTFQTMSYTIDVYNRKFKTSNNLLAFAAFVEFFPQLVAGPIERAKNLLPQFYTERSFKYKLFSEGVN